MIFYPQRSPWLHPKHDKNIAHGSLFFCVRVWWWISPNGPSEKLRGFFISLVPYALVYSVSVSNWVVTISERLPFRATDCTPTVSGTVPPKSVFLDVLIKHLVIRALGNRFTESPFIVTYSWNRNKCVNNVKLSSLFFFFLIHRC